MVLRGFTTLNSAQRFASLKRPQGFIVLLLGITIIAGRRFGYAVDFKTRRKK